MGVTGLWKLIEPCGKPVPVDTLEGKILAVDISIWLHQSVKGFQDNKGSALANAHLLGLFHRLCKLLYYRVRPVFVFDGCVPQLKRDTIARRRQERGKLNCEAERIQTLLLQSLAKEKVVQQALGVNAAELLLKSPAKRTTKVTRAENTMDELFKLPELPAAASNGDEHNDDSNTSTDNTTDDSSFDESNPRHSYNSNLQAIDVRSQHFRNLPADVRHEILVDIKETRKQSSWGRLHELPSRSDDFSTFQMKRLLKRRAVQESLEEAEQEMGGHTLTYAELQNFFTEEGIVEPASIEKNAQQICSDENTRYLLVRDLKKKLTKVENEKEQTSVKKEATQVLKVTPGTSAEAAKQNSTDSFGEEYDEDLKLAIALSLENTTQVYSEKDYEYGEELELKLNRDQRKQLQNAAVGPARSYMIEYAGMNDEEVTGILEKTQAASDDEPSVIVELFKEHVVQDEKKDEASAPKEVTKLPKKELEASTADSEDESNIVLRVSDAETDSDLEEVIESETKSRVTPKSMKSLEIVLDIKEPLASKDDLFADVFETEVSVTNTENLPTKLEEIKEGVSNESLRSDIKALNAVAKIEESSSGEMENLTEVISSSPADKSTYMLSVSDELQQQAEYAKQITLNDNKVPSNPAAKAEDIIKLNETTSKNKFAKMLSILDELKQQVENIKKINLNDIKVDSAVIEISDDEISQQLCIDPIKTEVIEICDNDDNVQHKPNLMGKSPKQKTPSKNNSITEYFETNFVIKRTPEKTAENEVVPKVKSPFFINKTPKSNRKRQAEQEERRSPASTQKMSKAAKMLFGNEMTQEEASKTIQEKLFSAEEVLESAANILKEQKTAEELQTLASDLAKERRELENERNKQDRMGMSITHRMNADCQELLRLFGIPFIVAPMEAEAQCAFLDAVELTNGTITDDSDIWLFGGRTVYKNFFAQHKHVLEFRAERIETSFNCDRKKLIQLACLVGSDYTTGIHGIGVVTALEILACFSPPPKENQNATNAISAALATLSRFRDWWQTQKTTATPIGSTTRLALRKKLKNIELNESFPSVAVVEAYLAPKVDENKDAFTWGNPDVESIREFAKKMFGWTSSKTDEILQPVLKKLNEKNLQTTIRNYFSVKSALTVRELKVSKRVQKAIDSMSGKIATATTTKPTKTTRPKRTKRKAVDTETNEEEQESTASTTQAEVTLATEPSTSENVPRRTRRTPRIPNPKQKIPQREQELERLRKNKEKAVRVLKKSAPTAAKKKR